MDGRRIKSFPFFARNLDNCRISISIQVSLESLSPKENKREDQFPGFNNNGGAHSLGTQQGFPDAEDEGDDSDLQVFLQNFFLIRRLRNRVITLLSGGGTNPGGLRALGLLPPLRKLPLRCPSLVVGNFRD